MVSKLSYLILFPVILLGSLSLRSMVIEQEKPSSIAVLTDIPDSDDEDDGNNLPQAEPVVASEFSLF